MCLRFVNHVWCVAGECVCLRCVNCFCVFVVCVAHTVMAGGDVCSVVNHVIDALTIDECKTLMFLTSDLLFGQRVEDTRSALSAMVTRSGQSRPADVIMMEVLFHLKRFDILKRILGKNREQVEEELRRGGVISPYR